MDANHIRQLVANAVPEGLRIDYKQSVYAPNEGKEFCRDACALTNFYGGFLVIGVAEREGVPTELVGVEKRVADLEIQRMESWLRDGIEPRILGVAIRAIDIDSEGVALVAQIPKSLIGPHRVALQGINRFYVRNSNGKHEASVEELRNLFGYSAQLSADIQKFVGSRRSRIISGADFISDVGLGRLIVHVSHVPTFRDQSFVDVRKLYEDPYRFAPNYVGGLTKQVLLEGVLVGHRQLTGYGNRTLIFRNGTIEFVYPQLLRDFEDIELVPGGGLMDSIIHSTRVAIDGLLQLGGSGPFVLDVALDVKKEAKIAFYNDRSRGFPAFDRSLVELPSIVILEPDQSKPTPLLIRPTLDSLWNAVGLTHCEYFQEDQWKPPN